MKQFTGKTEAIVKKKLREFKKEKDKFSSANFPKVTLKEYINNWLYNYKYNKLKLSSFDRLESTIVKHIIPNIGYLQFSDINQDDLQNLINALYRNKELSYSSIKKVYNALSGCFAHATIKGDLLRNPMAGVLMPAQSNFKKKDVIYFSEEEVNRFLLELERKYSTGKPIYYNWEAFIFILNTGIRIGEMLALKWVDVDFEKKTIHVRRNATLVKKRDGNDVTKSTGYVNLIKTDTKTYSGDRTIHLNKKAFEVLEKMKHKTIHCEYVVSNSKGNFVLPNTFEKTFSKIVINADLPKCGLHALRHTFASLLLKREQKLKLYLKL